MRRWFFVPRRRPRIKVERAPHEAQRRMMEDLARTLADRPVAPRRAERRTRSRRATVAVMAAILVGAVATTVTAATVFDVSLGVPSLDRLFRIDRDARPPGSPRPYVVARSTSPPVAVPPENGASGAIAAAFVDNRRGLCIAKNARRRLDESGTGHFGCATAPWVSRYLSRQPVYATGATFGTTAVIAGFTRADVVEMEMRAPSGRRMNVALLRRVWHPAAAPAARPVRVFVGAYHLTTGRLDAATADRAIDFSRYRARVLLRDGREVLMRLR